MAHLHDDEDYLENDFDDYYPAQKKRKSTKGRSLMRWDVEKDQLLLLMVDHVCQRDGVALPWDAIGALLTPKLTSEAIKQHLAKVRKARVDDGYEVPPPLDRSSRRKSKSAPVVDRHSSPVVLEESSKEEAGMKRSTLLPPRKPGRKGKISRKVQHKPLKETPKTAETPVEYTMPPRNTVMENFDLPYMPPQVTRYDQVYPHQALHQIAPTGYPEATLHDMQAPQLTADEQQLLDHQLSQVQTQDHSSKTASMAEPMLKSLRNDVFLGMSTSGNFSSAPESSSSLYPVSGLYGAPAQGSDPLGYRQFNFRAWDQGIPSAQNYMLSTLPTDQSAPMLHNVVRGSSELQGSEEFQTSTGGSNSDGMMSREGESASGQSIVSLSIHNKADTSSLACVRNAAMKHEHLPEIPVKSDHVASSSFDGTYEPWSNKYQFNALPVTLPPWLSPTAIDQSGGQGMLQHAAWLNATAGGSHDYSRIVDDNLFDDLAGLE